MASYDIFFIIILILIIIGAIIGGILFQREQNRTTGKGVGGKCNNDNDCQIDLICKQGTCQKPGISGGSCDANKPCPTGSFCGADKVCHVGLIPETGAACVGNSQCALGQFCNGIEQCEQGQPNGLNKGCTLSANCLVGQYCAFTGDCKNGTFIQDSFTKNNIEHILLNTTRNTLLGIVRQDGMDILACIGFANDLRVDYLWTYDNTNFTLRYNYGGTDSSRFLNGLNNYYAMITKNGLITVTPDISKASQIYLTDGPTTDGKMGYITDKFGNILNISTVNTDGFFAVAFVAPQYSAIPIRSPEQFDNYKIVAVPNQSS